MPASYTFTIIGNATGKIPVRLSFKIVELFSEGRALGFIMATDRTVELDQSPENVLGAIKSATKAHIENIETSG